MNYVITVQSKNNPETKMFCRFEWRNTHKDYVPVWTGHLNRAEIYYSIEKAKNDLEIYKKILEIPESLNRNTIAIEAITLTKCESITL